MGIGDLDRAALEEALQAFMAEIGKERSDDDPYADEVNELMEETRRLIADLGTDGARGEMADLLIERLIPTTIDVSLWRNVALGRNVHLPASDQYGPLSDRLAPSDMKLKKPPRGNAYGAVHSKGRQAPSDFMKRQDKEIEAATRRVLKLEDELKQAREDRENLEHGLRFYAKTCLLTAMRQSTASIFAMGPAWALLSAIRASSGDDVSEGQSNLETKRILVILHALREYLPFHRDLKAAVLSVCHKYEAKARERGEFGHEFDGPVDYAYTLDDLKWPHWEDPMDRDREPARPCRQCGFSEDDLD